jgi:stage III sporulation protein AA
LRVSVADERGELAASWAGRPQLEVGRRTDVMDGCPKAQALMYLLRAMNPQVLAVDEITAPEDIRALLTAAGCGVTLLATAHGADREDLRRRPLYRPLLEEGIFQRLVRICRENGRNIYHVEEWS